MSELIPDKIVTGEQIRGARAILRLDQRAFSALTHVPLVTIRRFERTRGPVAADEGILKTLCGMLQEAGIELIDAGFYEGLGGPGIRLAGPPDVVAEDVDLENAADKLEAEKPLVSGAS